MTIKTDVVSWYIRNILIPKMEDITNPGFIITQISDSGPITQLRDVLLPETLVANLEDSIVEAYGEEGRKALYSCGKKSNYVYSKILNLERIDTVSSNKFEEFTQYYTTYLAGTYATKLSRKLNMKLRLAELEAKDYIVCSKNGIGHLFTEGSFGGTWAYLINDLSAECTHIECQGRGAEVCKLVAAPANVLDSMGLKYFIERDMPNISLSMDYKILNKVIPTKYAKNSLKSLIDAGFFHYRNNRISFHDERYFECDTHYIYLLEEELKKLKGGQELLFKVSFEYGKLLAQSFHDENYNKFITDYISALGWGDVMVTKESLFVSSYPWTVYSNNSNFTLFRGIVSGLMSGFLDRNTRFEVSGKSLSGGHLDANFSAKKNL